MRGGGGEEGGGGEGQVCLMARAVLLQLSVEPNVWPSLNWQDCTVLYMYTVRVSYPRKGTRIAQISDSRARIFKRLWSPGIDSKE